MSDKTLFYGDNLEILRQHISDDSVDLVYLDPPFKSNQDYNLLFDSKDGTAAPAQIKAFEDTWRWDMAAAEAFEETIERHSGSSVAHTLIGLRKILGENDLLATSR